MLVMVIVTGNVTATMVTIAESTLLNHDCAVARKDTSVWCQSVVDESRNLHVVISKVKQ
jgi:hypothetical protein